MRRYLKNNGLVDDVIKEPLGGAHRHPEEMFDIVKKELKKHIKALSKIDADQRVNERIDKFCKMGVVNEK